MSTDKLWRLRNCRFIIIIIIIIIITDNLITRCLFCVLELFHIQLFWRHNSHWICVVVQSSLS